MTIFFPTQIWCTSSGNHFAFLLFYIHVLRCVSYHLIIFLDVSNVWKESCRCSEHVLHCISFYLSKIRFVWFTLILHHILAFTSISHFFSSSCSYSTLRKQFFPWLNFILNIPFQTIVSLMFGSFPFRSTIITNLFDLTRP